MADSPDHAQKWLDQLDDPDEYKRSEAALEIQRLEHPRAMEACLRTLNDGESEAHLDWTPSVTCLIEIGEPAFLPLVEKMEQEGDETLYRGMIVLEDITLKMWGMHDERDNKGELEAWRKWWSDLELGKDASPEQIRAALPQLKAWFQERRKD